jgi:uncharacterized protein (DUF2236 family)
MTESAYPAGGWAPSVRGECPQAQTSQGTADALPLGPQSLVWRYFGDNRMYLIGPRAAVLQRARDLLGLPWSERRSGAISASRHSGARDQ